jgi:hypothetical protein
MPAALGVDDGQDHHLLAGRPRRFGSRLGGRTLVSGHGGGYLKWEWGDNNRRRPREGQKESSFPSGIIPRRSPRGITKDIVGPSRTRLRGPLP